MFLNDKTVFRSSLFEGLKLSAHRQDSAINLCRFGPNGSVSLVTIAQSLDSILIYDLSSYQDQLLSGRGPLGRLESQNQNDPLNSIQKQRELAVSYISIKDQVIESVAVIEASGGGGRSEGSRRDLLLIGCSKSIMIYDACNQEHLFSVNTSSKITTISVPSNKHTGNMFDGKRPPLATRLLFCGGIQKLYAYQMDYSLVSDYSSSLAVGLELSNERTISDTVSCLIRGRIEHLECLVAGFLENRIRVYSVDLLEQSIQTCRLTLTESAKINCLCAIETIHHGDHRTTNDGTGGSDNDNDDDDNDDDATGLRQQPSVLPSIGGGSASTNANQRPALRQHNHQMNYFAYGLENGFIGVYRLLVASRDTTMVDAADDADQNEPQHHGQSKLQQLALFAERLWRHRSKQVPVSISLFDMDGDGLDELVVGYRNGRLEVRSPFTGELITSIRCFRSNGQLVGLLKWTIDGHQHQEPPAPGARNEPQLQQQQQSSDKTPTTSMGPVKQEILLACSSTSSLVAFKPKQRKPRRPLTDYLAQSLRNHHMASGVDGPAEGHDEFSFDSSGNQFLSTLTSEPGEKFNLRHTMEEENGESQHQLVHNDDDEEDQAHGWPISCESRQNTELLQEIGKRKKQQVELRQRFRQIQRELLRKQIANSRAALELITASGVAAEQSGPIQVAHYWNYDGTTNKLLLGVVLDSLVGYPVRFEMIELLESGKRLLPDGHLILNPVQSAKESAASVLAELVLSSSIIEQQLRLARRHTVDDEPKLADESIELQLIVYMGEDEARSGLPTSATAIRTVHDRTIILPKFAMFVPESLVDQTRPTGAAAHHQHQNQQAKRRPLIRRTFALPERASRLQILDWMHSNFLCFQFGEMIDHESQTELHSNEHELWQSAQDNRLDAMHLDASMMLSVRQFSANSNSSSGTTIDQHQLQHQKHQKQQGQQQLNPDDYEDGFKFELVDLRTLNESASFVRHIRMTFGAKERRLTIESDDSDLLVGLIQLLVMNRLQLSVKDYSVNDDDKEDGSGGVGMLLNELNTINESSRQLEESERRIQTEIYESAELIKSLIQQLGIANELQEFGISKQLLTEISMMLDGTQNSAQAFYLNNRSRLNLMKQANCLREKVLFLTGDDETTAQLGSW